MASRLVDFPTHYLPPSPYTAEASPLLQNPLLQSTFLLQHVLLPTLYSTLEPSSFKNLTGSRRFQGYLAKNNEVMDAVNLNLTDVIKRNYRKKGEAYEEDNNDRCWRKRSLGYSITSVQESLFDLQETVARKFLKRRLGSEVEDLVNTMLSHIELQKENLKKIKRIQKKKDDNEKRKRRTAIRCREPFFPVGKECFYLSHKVKLGWHEAQSACRKLGGYLAEPERPKALAKALRKMKGQFNRCWLGGSDEEQEGNWKWLSGGSLSRSQDWRPGQPSKVSTHGEVQNCLVILRHRTGGPLDDFSCWADRPFLCETAPAC